MRKSPLVLPSMEEEVKRHFFLDRYGLASGLAQE